MEEHIIKIRRHGILIAQGEYVTDGDSLVAGWFETIKPNWKSEVYPMKRRSHRNICSTYHFTPEKPPSLGVRAHAQLMIANAHHPENDGNVGREIEDWEVHKVDFDPIVSEYSPNYLSLDAALTAIHEK